MNCVISWRRQQQDSSTSCPIREPSPLKVWAAFVERMNRGSARRILVPRMLFLSTLPRPGLSPKRTGSSQACGSSRRGSTRAHILC
jgi:hypothetical protein